MIRDEKNFFFNIFLYRETIFEDLLKSVLENIRADTLLIILLLQLSKNFNGAVIKKYIKNIRNFMQNFIYLCEICNIFDIFNTISIVSVLKKNCSII